MPVTRRRFLTISSLMGTGFAILPPFLPAASAEDGDREIEVDFPTDPDSNYFPKRSREILTSVAEFILPGSGALGAARYIEQLLTAFDYDPPRIYFGNEVAFPHFLQLNREQQITWKILIYGSKAAGGLPNEKITGPVVGLREQMDQLIKISEKFLKRETYPFKKSLIQKVWSATPKKIQLSMLELVTQSAFSNPEYGGNKDGGGWKMIFFEGRSIPVGYSKYDPQNDRYIEGPAHPLSTANPGQDPAPVSWITKLMIESMGD